MKLLSLCRTLHIYLTLLGLAVLLFFGATGFVAHHSDWFSGEAVRQELAATTPAELIRNDDRLGVVEHLRKTFRITGALEHYTVSPDQVSVSFREPGREWDLDLEKENGKTTGEARFSGLAAVLKDLHKGQNAGRAWPWMLDAAAILLLLACVTGTILWLAMPRRRKIGVAALLIGTVVLAGIYIRYVPGADRPLAPPGPATAPISADSSNPAAGPNTAAEPAEASEKPDRGSPRR